MYLVVVARTRCGISAKNLERAIGVSYPTAWRMLNKICNELMADDGEQLTGDVEIDETSVDGRPRKAHGQARLATSPNRRSEAMKLRERSQATVFAAVEHDRGLVRQREALDPGHLPEGVAQVATWVSQRVHVALQPARSAQPVDVRRAACDYRVASGDAMNDRRVLEALRRAAARRRAPDDERHAASAELRKRVKDAHAAGVSPTPIAQEAGLSRRAVYEALQPS